MVLVKVHRDDPWGVVIMIIKYPDSDNAIRKLWELLDFTEDRFTNCVRSNHNALSVLYISSLIISPYVTYKGQTLIDRIRSFVDISPSRFICLVRTASPYNFPKNMRRYQEKAINRLRDKCYVVVYDSSHEFLNHAKFFVYYHICLSEQIVYGWRFYGSTNLTAAGLSSGSQNKIGNYEEFAARNPRPKLMLEPNDIFYLNEVIDLLRHKKGLYTEARYLREFIEKYLMRSAQLLQDANKIVSGTTLGELYEAYVSLLFTYNRVLSFLDEIPGKRLTGKLVAEIEGIRPSVSVFELEAMLPTDAESAELAAKDLGLSDPQLRKEIRNYIYALEKINKVIKDKYVTVIDEIWKYFDEAEHRFVEFLEKNTEYHINTLSKIVKGV